MKQACQVAFPDNYQQHTFLAFHRRDKDEIAERISESRLEKGVLWNNRPHKLEIVFSDKKAIIHLYSFDDAFTVSDLEERAKHMLGLNQEVTSCEQTFANDPDIGPLLNAQSGLRIPQSASPFEAICWAIMGQQISVNVAISLRRNLIQKAGESLPCGLYVHPGPEQILALSETELRQCSLSASKANALLALCRATVSTPSLLNQLPTTEQEAEAIRQALLAIKGIGPWTVNYALLRGYGWLDGSLHGDVAVRRNLAQIQQRDTVPDAKETEQWLSRYTPWRALIAAHLWAREASEGF